jgi:hypothetical protein
MSDGVAGSIGPTHTPKLSRLVAAKVYEQTSGMRAKGRQEAAPPGVGEGRQDATPPGIGEGDRFESSGRLDILAGQGTAKMTGGSAALPFYTNPASRVEAATAIALGRGLDVKG